jgi:hypothetical protein
MTDGFQIGLFSNSPYVRYDVWDVFCEAKWRNIVLDEKGADLV